MYDVQQCDAADVVTCQCCLNSNVQCCPCCNVREPLVDVSSASLMSLLAVTLTDHHHHHHHHPVIQA